MTPAETGRRPRRFQSAGRPFTQPYRVPDNEMAHGRTPWMIGIATKKTKEPKARAAHLGIVRVREALTSCLCVQSPDRLDWWPKE
jgi:hypothetical protein